MLTHSFAIRSTCYSTLIIGISSHYGTDIINFSESSFNIGDGKLTFTQFDVDKILSGSQPLLGSSGDEYKLPVDVEGRLKML